MQKESEVSQWFAGTKTFFQLKHVQLENKKRIRTEKRTERDLMKTKIWKEMIIIPELSSSVRISLSPL